MATAPGVWFGVFGVCLGAKLDPNGEIGEAVETGEIVEIVNTDVVFMQVAEKMAGCSKELGEYPTLSARKPFP